MATNVNTIKYELQVEDKVSATLREIESTIIAIGTSADVAASGLTNAEKKLAKLPKLSDGIDKLNKSIAGTTAAATAAATGKTAGDSDRLLKLKNQLIELIKITEDYSTVYKKATATKPTDPMPALSIHTEVAGFNPKKTAEVYKGSINEIAKFQESLSAVVSDITKTHARIIYGNDAAKYREAQELYNKSKPYITGTTGTLEGTEGKVQKEIARLQGRAGFNELNSKFTNGVGLTARDITRILQESSGKTSTYNMTNFTNLLDKLDKLAAKGLPDPRLRHINEIDNRTREERAIRNAAADYRNLIPKLAELNDDTAEKLRLRLIASHTPSTPETSGAKPISREKLWSPTGGIPFKDTELGKKYFKQLEQAIADVPNSNNLWEIFKWKTKSTSIKKPTQEQIAEATNSNDIFDPKSIYENDAILSRIRALQKTLLFNAKDGEKYLRQEVEFSLQRNAQLARDHDLAVRMNTISPLTQNRKDLRNIASSASGTEGRKAFFAANKEIDSAKQQKEIEKDIYLMQLYRDETHGLMSDYMRLKTMSKDALSAEYIQRLRRAFADAASELRDYITVSALVVSKTYETITAIAAYNNKLQGLNITLTEQEKLELQAQHVKQLLEERLANLSTKSKKYRDIQNDLKIALAEVNSELREMHLLMQQTTNLKYQKITIPKDYANLTAGLKARLAEEAIIAEHGAESVKHIEYNKAKAIEKIWKNHEAIKANQMNALKALEITPLRNADGSENKIRALDLKALNDAMATNIRLTEANVNATNKEFAAKLSAATALQNATKFSTAYNDALMVTKSKLTELEKLEVDKRSKIDENIAAQRNLMALIQSNESAYVHLLPKIVELTKAYREINETYNKHKELLKSNENLTKTATRLSDSYSKATIELKNSIAEQELILRYGANNYRVIEHNKAKAVEEIWRNHELKQAEFNKRLANIQAQPYLRNDGSVNTDRTINETALNETITGQHRATRRQITDVNTLYDARILEARATDESTRANTSNSESLLTNGRASQHLLTRLFQFDIGHRIVRNVVGAISAIPKMGIELDSARATFSAVFGTLQNVNSEFEFLDSLALKTGASIGVLREQYGQFASSAKFSGESAGKIRAIFNDITEAGTVLHLPADKLRSTFIAINQMYGKNQVMMEELKKQLGNQLPAAVSIFALSMGISTRKLMEDMKKGLVLPKETIAKFAATYRDFFADTSSFAIASRGLNAELGRLSNSWTYLSQSIYEDMSGTLTSGARLFASSLDFVKNNLDAVTSAAISLSLVTGASFLVHLVSKAAAAAITVGSLGIAMTRLNAANAAATEITALTTVANSGNFFQKLGVILPDIFAWLGKIVSRLTVIGLVAGTLYGLSKVSDTVNGKEIKLVDLVEAAWQRAIKSKNEYFNILPKEEMDSFFDKYSKWAAGNRTAIENTAKAAVAGIINSGGALRDSIKSENMVTIIKDAFSGKLSWFEIMFPDLVKDVQKVGEVTAKGIADRIKQSEIGAAAKDALLKTSEQISEETFANLQTKATMYMEVFGKVSDSINAAADLKAKVSLHIIQLEQQTLEKNFKANRISFLQYYETRVALAEKEYQIALKKNSLEKSVAVMGLNKAREFKEFELGNMSYSSVSKDAFDKAQKYVSELSYSTQLGADKTYGTAGVVFDDNKPTSKNATLIEATRSNLKAEQDKLKELKSTDTTLSAQQEYVLALADVAVFYKTDLMANTELMSKYTKETAENLAKRNRNFSEETIALNKGIMSGEGIDNNATLLKDSSARLALSQTSENSALVEQIKAIALKEGVKNINEFLANLLVESNLQQNARSPVGAVGIGQVMPTNTYAKGLDITTTEGNITAAARFWKHLDEKYVGNLGKMASAYNAGEKGVDVNHADTRYKETINHANRVSATTNALNSSNLPEQIETDLFPITGQVGKGIKTGNTTSNMYKYDSKIMQIDSKMLDAQYTKEKVLEDLENLRLEHTEKMRDSYTQSNIEVLKLTTTNGKQVALLENELKYKNDIKILNAMQVAHAKLNKEASEARTDEERKLIELKRSQLIPLSELELELQQQNINKLKEHNNTVAAMADLTKNRSTNDETFALRTEAVNLRESSGESIGKYGAAYGRSQIAKDRYNEMNSKEYRNSYMKTAIQESGGDSDVLANKMSSFNNELEKTKQAGQEVADLFANEISGNVTTALTDWATGNKSAMDSVKALGASIIKMIMDVIVQELILAKVKLMIKAMLMSVGVISTGGSADTAPAGKYTGGVVGYAKGGNVLQFPAGGRVKGKGSSLSDSNYAAVPKGSYILKASSANSLTNKYGSDLLVRLSNDEIVVPPALVKKYGKSFFDNANSHGDFAAGGSVGGVKDNVRPMAAKHNNTNNNQTNHITVNVDGSGKDGKELGAQISVEIVKQIAKQEAKREVNINNKQQRVAQRRVV